MAGPPIPVSSVSAYCASLLVLPDLIFPMLPGAGIRLPLVGGAHLARALRQFRDHLPCLHTSSTSSRRRLTDASARCSRQRGRMARRGTARTRPRIVSERLIMLPSFRRSPELFVLDWRSLPAKSTRWIWLRFCTCAHVTAIAPLPRRTNGAQPLVRECTLLGATRTLEHDGARVRAGPWCTLVWVQYLPSCPVTRAHLLRLQDVDRKDRVRPAP